MSVNIKSQRASMRRAATHVLRKHVSHGSSRHGQKRRARQAVEKSRNQHCLRVLCEGAGEHPDTEKCEGDDVDGSSPVELYWHVSCETKSAFASSHCE
jgi:hypothetical protein